MKKINLFIVICCVLLVASSCAKKSACPAYNKEAVHNPFDEIGKDKKKEKKNGLVRKKQPKVLNKK